MKRAFSSLVLGGLLIVGGDGIGFAQDFSAGVAAYERQDYATAFREMSVLANQGNAMAQHYLAMMYTQGQGVTQDYQEAAKWSRLSAEQGLEMAQAGLGWAYQNGRGVTQDFREAMKWYRLSAEQGNPIAQNNLGQMYGLGQGIAQDYVYAHMWFNIAASNGIENAGKIRDSIAQQMTKEQIAEAQKLARECQQKNFKGC